MRLGAIEFGVSPRTRLDLSRRLDYDSGMAASDPKITVQTDGPYRVCGRVALVRKEPIVSEHGEPLAWRPGEPIAAGIAEYLLCRCGRSGNKPFCDGSHLRVGFDGAESAPTGPSTERRRSHPGPGLHLRDDEALCVHAGFCGNRRTNVWKMVARTEDTQLRAQLMAMVGHCPSGRLSYALEPDGADIEPDLPLQIAVIPDGPLWVTGGIPTERADGAPFETRPRVTLCRCGASRNKPLCDGSHAEIGFRDPARPHRIPGAAAMVDPPEAVERPASGPAPGTLASAGSGATDATHATEVATATPDSGAIDAPAGAAPDTPATPDDRGRHFRYMAEFIGFTEADAELIRRTKPVIQAALPRIVTDFYNQLLRYPPTRRFFEREDGTLDQDYLELRMRHQINFWLRTAEGVFDDDYAAYVDYVGRAHTARGADRDIYIAERYVIGMVGFVQHAISRALMRSLTGGSDPDFPDDAVEAWDKLVMVILESLARAYGHERVAESLEPVVAVDRKAVADLADRAVAAELRPARRARLVELRVGAAAEIPEGERRLVEHGGLSVGLFHHEGRWYALRNRCLHRGGPVATGPLAGSVITCPWHGFRYDITSGACLADPLARLETYEVLVREGEVFLLVPEQPAEPEADHG